MDFLYMCVSVLIFYSVARELWAKPKPGKDKHGRFWLHEQKNAFGLWWQIWSGVRPRHFGWLFLDFACMIIVGLGLYYVIPDSFTWGWGHLVFGEGANLYISPAKTGQWFGLVFVAVLFFAVPKLALFEEQSFRKDANTWRFAVTRSVIFGLVHMLVAIPLGAGIVLIASGMIFHWCYLHEFAKKLGAKIGWDKVQLATIQLDDENWRDKVPDLVTSAREACFESTRVHTLHNTLVVLAILVSLVAQ